MSDLTYPGLSVLDNIEADFVDLAHSKAATADGYQFLARCHINELEPADKANQFSRLSVKIVVPPEPSLSAKQIVSIFPGLQRSPHNSAKAILQPVLQWNTDLSLKGWTIASWLVRGKPGDLDIATKSSSIAVQVGDVIAMNIELLWKGGGIFGYHCGFEGYEGASLFVDLPYDLSQIGLAMEAYHLGIDSCASELPYAREIMFSEIRLETNDQTQLLPSWRLIGGRTKCGLTMRLEDRVAKGDTVVIQNENIAI